MAPGGGVGLAVGVGEGTTDGSGDADAEGSDTVPGPAEGVGDALGAGNELGEGDTAGVGNALGAGDTAGAGDALGDADGTRSAAAATVSGGMPAPARRARPRSMIASHVVRLVHLEILGRLRAGTDSSFREVREAARDCGATRRRGIEIVASTGRDMGAASPTGAAPGIRAASDSVWLHVTPRRCGDVTCAGAAAGDSTRN
jgi:hypothetical protein